MRLSFARYAALAAFALACSAQAAETETQYLSGKGKDDPVQWDFLCDKGMKANVPSKINVPSNWELQGFGTYTYGRPAPQTKVHGIYKRTFTTPATWDGKAVFLNFEGVMTDTQVTVNGQSAGAMHQGGYYAFKYDITKLLKPAGQENQLQVDVDDESANASVNNAERRGDYWNYAGIFRPVYLEALPAQHIEHLAIDAKADGTLTVEVALPAPVEGASIKLQVRDAEGKPFGAPVSQPAGAATNRLTAKFDSPQLWNAETPTLYTLDVQLVGSTGEVHTVHQKFGFRTVEARPGQGLFINGARVMLKGVDRHSFWPDSGRCLSEQLSRDDITLIKEMNMNAVRSSHYPPDRHFLDACDEMGIYVLDELAGWHQRYDTQVGQKLVREMVQHDVNHPSILFWDNGNEGGWNTALDGEFAKYDPQGRLVLHPWDPYPQGIVDTKHYPSYDLLTQKLAGNAVYFPTEMLHGLYDGGMGAGLNEFWDAILKSKTGAGGFLWVFADESLKRTDKGGILDSAGNQAPDGIVGPYREKEGSFYTVKQIWSPVVVTDKALPANNVFTVENRYAFTDLQKCAFTWEARKFRQPGETAAGFSVVDSGKAQLQGAVAPGATGKLALSKAPAASDAVALTARDPAGKELWTWVYLTRPAPFAPAPAAGTAPRAADGGDTLTATAGELSLQINSKTGLLAAASRGGKTFSLANGPRFVSQAASSGNARGNAGAPATAPESTLTSLKQKTDGNDLVVDAVFSGPVKSMTYRLHPDGWLDVSYSYTLSGAQEYFGVGFDYPEANVKGMKYLGEGPGTVYKNRLAGGTLDVWEKKYNNTMVGDPDTLKPGEHFDYPIFKGLYAGVRWVQLNTSEGPITAVVEQTAETPTYVQIFTPKTPPAGEVGQTGVPFPKTGISFLQGIPAIGSKFVGPRSSGPAGQPVAARGEYSGRFSLFFGDLPKQ